ncbi:conserved hypothetical protein [Leishmania major strain Friedlin]|uniref:Uncharacterized protein L1648.04 n=1 Tax=Leishmania major TaxID=5664 RepID=Q9U1E4_LEIMA|nr:conserved hypothetical protein [Leishmania major strain Friedlin]CAB55366.1 hypothetical protein L1648.04 [Leishmania major]CAG9580431.1 hypothetical_protein_-_conserved [Leishmania major strain Friedlin]CAJ08820.1 conserved hypothetical protein [Leishmania major strain Friedlin]|eukprot:XP_001685616.1 conserved hypothetical protein [Leishmania major strain Friedlin]
MRIRDIVIIGVAFVCSIICWSQEGSLNFQRGFMIPILDNELTEVIMPKPILVDPDGSGSRVLLSSTTVGYLSIYNTYYSRRRIDESFVRLNPSAELNVYTPIVGIGAGYTELNSSIMLCAVVTEDYQLIAVSIHTPSPTVLWKTQLVGPRYWSELTHASISIVPERNWAEDVGMIAVAAKVVDTSGVEMMMYSAFDAKTGARRWAYFSDGGNEMNDVVREANNNGTQTENGVTDLRLLDRDGAAKGGINQHDYLLGRKYEQPWTTFRESVMASMPHRYAHVWDAQLYPHVFYRAKAHRKARSSRGKAERRATFRYNDRVVHMETDDGGNLGKKLSALALSLRQSTQAYPAKNATRRHRRPSNVFVFHGEQGVEVVHMYTGSTVTSVMPLKAGGACYDDINGDLVLESVSTQIGPRSVVYATRGIDLKYDCLGIIEAGAPSSADELFNATVCNTQGLFGNLDLIHHFVDGDIRGEEAPRALNTLELLGSRNVVSSMTRATPPLILQVQQNMGAGLQQVERYAAFMIDTGLVTCIDPSRRRVLWRAQTGARFAPSPSDDMAEARKSRYHVNRDVKPFPQMVPYSLMQKNRETDMTFVGGGKESFRRVDTYVLAVGDAEFSIIKTKNGKVTRSVSLKEPPVAPVLVVDFNGDGTNDLIIVSKYHVFGFVGSSRASSETVAALMLLLVGLLGILFAVREKKMAEGDHDNYTLPVHTGDKVQRKRTFKRSTD